LSRPGILFTRRLSLKVTKVKKLVIALAWLLICSSFAFALFDTGTAMEKGKFELDVSINPLTDINYGQNFVFLHYGLGNEFELHGFFSKHGDIYNWNNSNYEGYIGLLKQWYSSERLDLATCVGIRKVLTTSMNPSLIGPGFLYTYRINQDFRLAGHLQYIGDFSAQGLVNYGRGYTSEVGFYWLFTEHLELALGIFTNSQSLARPIYTFNYYF